MALPSQSSESSKECKIQIKHNTEWITLNVWRGHVQRVAFVAVGHRNHITEEAIL